MSTGLYTIQLEQVHLIHMSVIIYEYYKFWNKYKFWTRNKLL